MSTVEPIKNLKDLKKIEKYLYSNKRDLLLFTFGTNCGLRISDILSLNIEDVRKKNFIQIKEQKTGKSKKFPINSKLKPMIEKFTKNKNPKHPLFITRFNNRLDRFTAYRIIKTACLAANPEIKAGTHTLRKTFGYHHYKKFKDIVLLQKIFNHSNPATTLRYIGIEEDEIFKSYNNFIL